MSGYFDYTQIAQVVRNLVDNAAKFSSPGSPITIAASRSGGATLLVVTDSGPGIDPDDLPHIFDRLYRGRATQDGVPGTGLGLAICKGIVEAHGGRVAWSPRADGVGSTFSVTLPSPSANSPSAMLEGSAV